MVTFLFGFSSSALSLLETLEADTIVMVCSGIVIVSMLAGMGLLKLIEMIPQNLAEMAARSGIVEFRSKSFKLRFKR